MKLLKKVPSSTTPIPLPYTTLTFTPNLARPWTLLINSEEVRAACAATSNAPAPGTTLQSSMAFLTALRPSRTASLIWVMVCLFGPEWKGSGGREREREREREIVRDSLGEGQGRKYKHHTTEQYSQNFSVYTPLMRMVTEWGLSTSSTNVYLSSPYQPHRKYSGTVNST